MLIFCCDDQLFVGDMTKIKGIGQKKKDGKGKEETIDAKLNQEIEKLDNDIMTSRDRLQSSMNFILPDCKEK